MLFEVRDISAAHKRPNQLTQKARTLNEEPDQTMLAQLRVLEKKMGLVLTLVCIPYFRAHGYSTCLLYGSSKPLSGESSMNNQLPLKTTIMIRTTRQQITDPI